MSRTHGPPLWQTVALVGLNISLVMAAGLVRLSDGPFLAYAVLLGLAVVALVVLLRLEAARIGR